MESTVAALKRKRPTALEEEEYVECLEKIIQRDFFPDLPKLRMQWEWHEARTKGDVRKLREIQERYAKERGASSLPESTPFRTPNFTQTPAPVQEERASKRQRTGDDTSESKEVDVDKIAQRHSVDSFVQNFTSEDNAAFAQIMEKAEEKRKRKLWWMTEKTEQMKLLDSSQAKNALTWPNEPSDLLLYPKMLDPSAVHKRELVPEATRFRAPDWKKLKEAQKKAANDKKEEANFQILNNQEFTLGARRKAEGLKKVDLDDLLGSSPKSSEPGSPKVDGYGFVLEPSSTPSKHDPIMTWGEIQGTPLLLDPMDTPINIGGSGEGPAFAVPKTPRREQLGLELADKVKKKQVAAAKREKNARKVTPNGQLTPRSEVGQKLVAKLSRRAQASQDPQLRASYTSPRTPTRSSGIQTPRTPSTPSVRKLVETPKSQKPESNSTTTKSLTDGLIDV